MECFEEVKRLVTVPEAAEFYGFHQNRSGFISCPFHSEKTPSLKLRPASWRCYGCGKSGTVIDFAGELFGLSPIEAVRRINDDFHLGLPLDRPQSSAERAEANRRRHLNDVYKTFQAWRERMLNNLCAACRVGWIALRDKTPGEWNDAELQAVKWHDVLEYWAETLDAPDIETQMTVFRHREGVERLCRQLLKSTLPRSKAG